jgi:hypothetical protein
MGNAFQSDGRLMGQESIQTVACDQTANTCSIKVPAPGFALVFLTDAALSNSSPGNPVTFPTTAYTKTVNTLKVDPSVLATSNGHSAKSRPELGSTSKGSSNGAGGVRVDWVVVMGLVAGGIFVGLV